jgi:hypothetical protein
VSFHPDLHKGIIALDISQEWNPVAAYTGENQRALRILLYPVQEAKLVCPNGCKVSGRRTRIGRTSHEIGRRRTWDDVAGAAAGAAATSNSKSSSSSRDVDNNSNNNNPSSDEIEVALDQDMHGETKGWRSGRFRYKKRCRILKGK